MGCYCGKELKYDSKGVLVDGGQPDSWTICRDIRIDKGLPLQGGPRQVDVHSDGHAPKLRLDGRRL